MADTNLEAEDLLLAKVDALRHANEVLFRDPTKQEVEKAGINDPENYRILVAYIRPIFGGVRVEQWTLKSLIEYADQHDAYLETVQQRLDERFAEMPIEGQEKSNRGEYKKPLKRYVR